MRPVLATAAASVVALSAQAQSPDARSLHIEKISESASYRVECTATWNKLDPSATYEIVVNLYDGFTIVEGQPHTAQISRDNSRVSFTDTNGFQFQARMTGDGTITAKRLGVMPVVPNGSTPYFLHNRGCVMGGRNVSTGQHFPRTWMLDQQESQSPF